MRLLGDPTEKATLEINDGYNWGRVCEFENIKTATIACRHFGYNTALAAIPVPIEGGRPKILKSTCRWGDRATSLLQCNTRITDICLCSEYDAGLICSIGKKSPE